MNNLNKPLISILTPSYNRAEYLKKLISSLELQTYKNFEWIVGNDGSTDDTDKLISNISQKLSFKITYINSSLRVGKAKMDNLLLEQVHGEFILWCDSDDYLYPNSLEILVELYEKIPIKEKDNYIGVIAQNIDTNGKSQTFSEDNIPKKEIYIKWEDFYRYIKGDGTILGKSYYFKNKKFLEVDLLITEGSLLSKIYSGKKFILSPTIVKVMDRNAENSVSYGNKIRYSRGSAYCIAEIETSKVFIQHPFSLKIKKIINYWRYSFHGDLPYIKAKKMWGITRKNLFFSLLYPIALLICLRDNLMRKVEKTHIQFNHNINKTNIVVNNLK